ncbi:hypothetical protein DDZ13_11050 [Coraliomargarita sinensis]|uniref:Uncharacterized protein n=1 Tax=Coraliomargarita sinensis TaxID=2174842 RepID=A0A317ZDT3_9BACT|nr:hypothetical protein [Coraliomargarita sinensis]PXA03514.1 hypothetical protein DDZ13_11050 [Coraliomargarita sinensis]
MSPKSIPLIPTLLLLLLSLGPGFQIRTQAQQSSSPDSEQIKVRFRAMGWSGTCKDLFYLQGGKAETFTATSANPSKWLEYRGPTPLILYKKGETTLNAEGEIVPRPVGSFDPPGPGEYLLLLKEKVNGASTWKYQIFPLAETGGEVEPGYRIVNFTDKELAIKINDEQAIIPRGEFQHLKPTARDDNSLSVATASKEADGWKVKYRNLFREKPGIRTTVFLSESGKRVQVRRFLDRATRNN